MPNEEVAADHERTITGDSLPGETNPGSLNSREFPVDPMIGRSLDGGKYRIVGVIGRGGMSIVYKAVQELVGRYVAIKTLTLQLVGDQNLVKRFTREVQAIGKLNHPNIVTAFDCCFDEQGQPYFIMDYLEGISLAEALDELHHIEQHRLQNIAIQVCSAVWCAHSNGILHRDLKPANIMLLHPNTEDEQVKIVDFGVAKITEDVHKLTATGELWGTPSYMSPEQAHGHYTDFRSDIYSVGCVMYEALTGRTPFEGQSPIDTLMMHINNPVPPFEVVVPELHIHPDLEAIVVKALEKDVTKRYQTMKEMERAVRALKLDAPPGSLGTALGPDSPDAGQFEICPKCAKQKRPAQEGSITSWLRADSTCTCQPQTNAAQANQAQQPVNVAEQNYQQNAAPATNTDNRYNRFAQDRGQIQEAQAAPPVRNTNAIILLCAGIALCLPIALFFIFKPGVNGSGTGQPPAQAAPAAAQIVPTSPVSQATPMTAPNQPTFAPTSTTGTTSSLGPQPSATTQNTVAQHPSTGPSPTPPGNEQHPAKTPRPAANNNSNETKANSRTHPIKKAKKHHVAADGSSPVRPLDDMDRWQQFQSGQ